MQRIEEQGVEVRRRGEVKAGERETERKRQKRATKKIKMRKCSPRSEHLEKK